MKVTPDDLANLRAAVAPLDTDARRARYMGGEFPRAALVKDLEFRYRWDLFWEAQGMERMAGGGRYADAHIDTALRKIVPPLGN